MIRTVDTLNAISLLFCEATKEVLDTATGKEIVFSKIVQKVPVVHMRPAVSCFVLFSGDYSGLMIMNFSMEAAMSIYRNSMLKMGLPEDELAQDFTADDVQDNTGETVNQIIGKVRKLIEDRYGLVASNTQPKALSITTSITLTIDAQDLEKELNRRIAFKIEGHSFHIEFSLEKTEFVSIDGENPHLRFDDEPPTQSGKQSDIDALMKGSAPQKAAQSGSSGQPDFDALMKGSAPQKAAQSGQPDFDVLMKESAPQKPAQPNQPKSDQTKNNDIDFEALMAANK